MNTALHDYQVTTTAATEGLRSFILRHDDSKPRTLAAYVCFVRGFLQTLQRDYPNPPGILVLNESRMMDWLAAQSSVGGRQPKVDAVRVASRYLDHLHQLGHLRDNPLRAIRGRHGNAGWVGIARGLRAPDPHNALKQLCPGPAFSGSFGRHARSYLELQRAAGKRYHWEELVLADFNRFIRRKSIYTPHAVTADMVRQWMEGKHVSQESLRSRLQVLSRFFVRLRHLAVVRGNPVPEKLLDLVGVPKRTFKPFIFTQAQLKAMLAAAEQLPATDVFVLRGPTMHTLLALLYTLGLRISEALSLMIGDVNLQERVLLIRQTKFHKERWVPFGPRMGQLLQRYLAERRAVVETEGKEERVFMRRKRRPATSPVVRHHFRTLLRTVGIAACVGRKRPRIHDLRHSFAVHRLLGWYRQGVDVQVRLPLLSTFMGHVSVQSTQVYLTMTDDLLQEANRRFEAKFGPVTEGGTT